MELDNRNFHRLLRYAMYNITKNYKRYLAYLYILLYYVSLLNYLADSLTNVVWPLKPFFSFLKLGAFLLLFFMINHILVSKYISHKVLCLVEILLVISISICLKIIFIL